MTLTEQSTTRNFYQDAITELQSLLDVEPDPHVRVDANTKIAAYRLKIEEASIDDLVNQAAPDFERAMKRVISENQELYRRLA